MYQVRPDLRACQVGIDLRLCWVRLDSRLCQVRLEPRLDLTICHVGSDSMSGWGGLLTGLMLDRGRDVTLVRVRLTLG